MFVTKSGIVVVVIESSRSSTTVMDSVRSVVNETCRFVLTIRSHERFLLERSWLLFFLSIFTAKAEEFCIPGTEGWMRRSTRRR